MIQLLRSFSFSSQATRLLTACFCHHDSLRKLISSDDDDDGEDALIAKTPLKTEGQHRRRATEKRSGTRERESETEQPGDR